MNRARYGCVAVRRLAAVALVAFAASCGGSSSSSDGGDAPSAAEVAGTWHEEPGGLSCSFAELGDVPVTASFGDFDFDVVVVGGGALLIDGLTAQPQGVGPNLEATTFNQFGTGYACLDGTELLSQFVNRYVFYPDGKTGIVDHQWTVGCASGKGSCSREINDDIRKKA